MRCTRPVFFRNRISADWIRYCTSCWRLVFRRSKFSRLLCCKLYLVRIILVLDLSISRTGHCLNSCSTDSMLPGSRHIWRFGRLRVCSVQFSMWIVLECCLWSFSFSCFRRNSVRSFRCLRRIIIRSLVVFVVYQFARWCNFCIGQFISLLVPWDSNVAGYPINHSSGTCNFEVFSCSYDLLDKFIVVFFWLFLAFCYWLGVCEHYSLRCIRHRSISVPVLFGLRMLLLWILKCLV